MAGGFQRCVVDHSVFYRRTTSGCVLLTVYVDDILLTCSDAASTREIKEYLRTHFVTKDRENLRYFLSIEFAYTRERIALFQ